MQPKVEIIKNEKFELASELVLFTGQSLFLTGKAGTGKTTFLKYIKEHCTKNMVVVAPTGVAAINAGGMTMHSFFQLPLQSFVPKDSFNLEQHPHVVTPSTMFSKLRLHENKRSIMRDLELLVIDEVSMVSPDMLDCVDLILRTIRKRYHEPFGGVQLLLIGDMYQLPPIVRDDTKEIMSAYYAGPYFYESWAIKKLALRKLQLDTIYRQSDPLFISLLNQIRMKQFTEHTLELLNGQYQPDFEPDPEEGYITLTTHNAKADRINQRYLENLHANKHSFIAEISGEFNEKAVPTEMEMELKVGAQVMFVRNDPTEEKRYYNGKIGWIKSMQVVDGEKKIVVKFNGEPDLTLERVIWENVRYAYNKEKDAVEQEVIGTFKQFPIRLAWAITIHKSQGLTFDKALIDAGDSFSAGQVYVALSRCRSLQGIVSKSRITPQAVITDETLSEYDQYDEDLDALRLLVDAEKEKYVRAQFKKVFALSKLVQFTEQWCESIPEKKLPNIVRDYAMAKEVVSGAQQLEQVVFKFYLQLDKILQGLHDRQCDLTVLDERVEKAISYFTLRLGEDILVPLQKHLMDLKYTAKVKQYIVGVETLYKAWRNKLDEINQVTFEGRRFNTDTVLWEKYRNEWQDDQAIKKEANKKTKKTKKPEKGDTYDVTYELLTAGHPLHEVADMRNLSVGTIESHLAALIEKGKIDIYDYYDKNIVDLIVETIEQKGSGLQGLTGIKSLLPDEISYGTIRAVVQYLRFKNAAMQE